MALFSIGITVGGVALSYFADVTVKRSQDGFGFSGLVTSQLSFTTTLSAWNAVGTYAMASVVVSGVSNVPTFYIDSRKASGNTVTVTALDRMAFTDTTFPYSSLDGTDDNVQLSAVLELICSTCGFDGYSFMDVNSLYNSYYPRSRCEDAACSDILSEIATEEIGTWCVIDNTLTFYPFGSGYAAGGMTVSRHTAMNKGLSYTVAGVRYTDGSGNEYDGGSTTYSYNTIQIDSEFATAQAAAAAYSRVGGTFSVVSVSKGLVTSGIVPYAPYLVTFGQDSTQYQIHSVTAKIECYGILCEFSTNNPLTSELGMRGRLTRAVQQKVTLNKQMGCQMTTPYQGTVYVDEEES